MKVKAIYLPTLGVLAIICIVAVFVRSANAESPFTEEAFLRGIAYTTSENNTFGKGLAFVDLDADGDDDLIATGAANGVVGIWENDGDGFFTYRQTGGTPRALPKASSVCAADYNADGLKDVYIGNWVGGGGNLLLRNNGNFSFTDVAQEAGVNDLGAAGGCAWADYDNDGKIDLYVANRTGSESSPIPNRLYRNRGDGTFVDVAQELGVADQRLSCQVLWFDLGNDGDADFYLSTDKGYATGLGNRMFRNDGGTFVEISAQSGTDILMEGMGIDATDVNGDGDQDIYITNSALGNPLFVSVAPESYIDGAAILGVTADRIGWGTAFFDYDQDGFPDLYVCNFGFAGHNNLFSQNQSGNFLDEAPATSCNDAGGTYCMAVSDVDGDGDQDFIIQNAGSPLKLYINQKGGERNYIQFDVKGMQQNLDAIGAVVDMRIGSRRQMREVRAGSNYKSQSSMRLHFGLDYAGIANPVTVRWPGGDERVFENLPANAVYPLYQSAWLGDMNKDRDYDAADAALFVDVILGNDTSIDRFMLADFNADFAVDGRDLAMFVERMLMRG